MARDKVSDDLLPRLSGALTAAAASPIAVEAAKRGQATLAAAKGELTLPEPKKKGRWVKRLAIVAAVTAVAVVAFRKFFGTKDADWQAARPSTPYAPPTPPTPPTPAPADVPIVEVPEATDSDDRRWTWTPRPVTIPRPARPPTTKASRPTASRCRTSRPKAAR